MPAPDRQKEKIAVLGGGPSALSALYWLTSTQELRDRYEITVYQMGWRAGGKGASGRGEYGRIEEHGLHVLFGFYQNVFYMMRSVYAELDRPDHHPMRRWRQAFQPHGAAAEEAYVMGRWDPWIISFPRNSGVPGSGGALPTLGQYIAILVQLVVATVFGWRMAHRFTRLLYGPVEDWENHPDPPLGGPEPPITLAICHGLVAGLRFLTRVVRWIRNHARWLVRLYQAARRVAWHGIKRLAGLNRRAHRFWLQMDSLLALVTGVIVDGLFDEGGFDAIDDEDYREWLLRHGLHPESADITTVRTVYDAAFSYEKGDPDRQRIAAGAAARLLIRAASTFKGAGFYRMRAGMGDAVFAPLYQVLRRRGVRFEFFHKVEALRLSEDGARVQAVEINRQARLAEGRSEYEPLVDVRGLECWPSRPLYDQLEPAEGLEGVDLESYYSGWEGERVRLEADVDFDKVIFAIPIGAVRFVCRDLVDNPATPQWRAMVDKVKSVQTVAGQLWFKHDLRTLGWPGPEPLLSLFVEPFNTWADMSQVLPAENWPPNLTPRDVSYFTGAQPGPTDPPDPADPDNRDFPERMTAAARADFLRFLQGRASNPGGEPGRGGLTTLLPGAASPFRPEELDWGQLIDPLNRHGEARLDAQYHRSDCGPSERCTLSLPGTNRFRMKAGETGYQNLYVTGDWTDNELYMAFMEGTFQSGILTARAVAGQSFPIIGEWLNRL